MKTFRSDYLLMILITVNLLGACAPSSSFELTVNIDDPRDGSILAPSPHTISAHVNAADAVGRVSFSANGTDIGEASSPDASGNYQLDWTPTIPGEYLLRAEATSSLSSID